MRKAKYTKSRMHEKLGRWIFDICIILTVSVIYTTIKLVSAESESVINAKIAGESLMKAQTVKAIQKDICGSENKVEYNTLTGTGAYMIRCTVYCDTGYTASGEWTTDGCLAGRKEWLGKQCKLYRVNADKSQGECIGTFTFKDTGFGLDELYNRRYETGTIMNGVSIDMWHPTEEECWDWVAEYGDYVYLEFI